MKKAISVLGAIVLLGAAISSVHAETRFRMSTTTSTEASGLLSVLLPPFEKANNVKVDVISVGTGKALKLGENGDVDVVFVHARPAEDKFVAEGYGVDRRDVMYNDFVIVGPKDDPAKIKEAKTAVEAFKRLAEGKADFISRGDDSGTDRWRNSFGKPQVSSRKGNGTSKPAREWAKSFRWPLTRRAMLWLTEESFIAYEGKIDLVIVLEGDKALFNPYGIIAVNPKKHPKVNYDLAKKFIDYVTGPEGQKVIADFKMNGKQLFFPGREEALRLGEPSLCKEGSPKPPPRNSNIRRNPHFS